MTIPNYLFKSYFAGLLEGDGSFITPLVQRDTKNRLRYPAIKVAFHDKDRPLADILVSYYGGHIEEEVSEKGFAWWITSKDEILLVCFHINGYLRTPKINDFSRMINFIKARDSLLQFKILPLDKTPLNSNAWLAGFSDADGNFSLSISTRKNGKMRIQLFFRIEVTRFYKKKSLVKQSEDHSSFMPICETIADFLGLKIYRRTRKGKGKIYHLIIATTTSFKTNANAIEYFERFPLFSSKYLDYSDWKYVHEMQMNKLHLTVEGQKFCKEIRQNYNSTRHIFCWNHLNHFYLKVNEK